MSMSKGSRNLVILGIGAILVTVITTSVSLILYRVSGDIYLDRSRPGYLLDKEEVEQNPPESTNFTFSDTGPLTAEDLIQYLEELKNLQDRLNEFEDPFSPDPLSDVSLGISSELPEQPDTIPLEGDPGE